MLSPRDPAENPAEELALRDELDERLRWLVQLRWVALVGVFLAIGSAWAFTILRTPWPLFLVATLMALLNLGFRGLHAGLPERTLRALTAEALLQIGVDVVGLGLLIFFSGGLSNPFVFYFTFHVVLAAILLDRQRAYLVAGLTTGVVAFLALAEEINGLGSWPLGGVMSEPSHGSAQRLGMVFVIGTTLVFSAYIVSTIMDRLRRHSRDVRRLNADLAERVDLLAAAERKLSAEHERARAILECMDEGVAVVDLSGKVLLSNTAAQASALAVLPDTLARAGVLGIPDAPVPVSGALPACAEAPACLTSALSAGGKLSPAALAMIGADVPTANAPARLRPPATPALVQVELNGRYFENTVSAVRTVAGEPLGLVVVSRDVTERRLLERQVVHAEKLHAAGSLAAGVAHELNTPLGTILGYAQMLLEDGGAGLGKELQSIEDQARRCRRIVQGLLDFARKSGGGRERLSLDALAAKTVELTAHSLEMRGVALELRSRPGGLPVVSAAANEIEQVLVNLITNAADALADASAPMDGGRRVVVSSSLDESAGVAVLAVEDNGPGVPEHLREEIFEPFFTTKAAGKGTGLGLSIARRIVEDHGGSLKLVSRADGRSGARFEIRLPVAEAERRRKMPVGA